MAVGESRSELLAWLNASFHLDYTKVEQCGTGAAYCQIIDSIYGGVPLGKVKFGRSISDYDARNNMKVLQAAFNRHNITKQIDTERLIKCRLQDNLELLQWCKRHWMDHKDVNVDYDAVARRKGETLALSLRRSTLGSLLVHPPTHTDQALATRAPRTPSGGRSSMLGSSGVPANGSAAGLQKRRVASSTLPQGSTQHPSSARGVNGADAKAPPELAQQLAQAKEEALEYKIMAESLETERNFYFNKLREIEVFAAEVEYLAANSTAPSAAEMVLKVQEIIFRREEGFEVQAFDADSF